MRDHLEPGPEHPITVLPLDGPVVVTRKGRTIARSTAALRLAEAGYPVVIYIPRADVDQSVLTRSEHTTHCPYKGDAAYFDLADGDERIDQVAWSYEDPWPAVEAIRGHLAFYPDRVDISSST
ncbi:hypothetical protein CGZ93_06305 [Enemella dayhoffiae]|uniref:DUF427 domain-containing protein n=1 Tax=Enemella dayhoffiae TaxID=2016507 RepID=A0A255H6H3_9ACTN|nr:DUF427 domain-containing protein [Enemella dayhoffiae]OYO23072.1 hypothetical protein CGZ93_06305 [Enemella dayhoffiae]